MNDNLHTRQLVSDIEKKVARAARLMMVGLKLRAEIQCRVIFNCVAPRLSFKGSVYQLKKELRKAVEDAWSNYNPKHYRSDMTRPFAVFGWEKYNNKGAYVYLGNYVLLHWPRSWYTYPHMLFIPVPSQDLHLGSRSP